jgi:N-acetylneuraminate synthase
MSRFTFPDSTFIIAEIGINHNGSLDIAKQLIDAAVDAGCDAVKFQMRVPHLSLRPEQWGIVRDTPWGERMTYLEYRQRIELRPDEYLEIDSYCHSQGILWFASPWDIDSVRKIPGYDMPLVKVPSAMVTNLPLIEEIAKLGRPVIMSTGMCDLATVDNAVSILYPAVPELGLLVCTSNYPAKAEDLNLSRIYTLQQEFPACVVGYSGHEPGLWTTLCAVAMGARIIERHITLDRTMPGTDQAGSVEPTGFKKLVKEIRNFEAAFGTPELRILDSEVETVKRLRG